MTTQADVTFPSADVLTKLITYTVNTGLVTRWVILRWYAAFYSSCCSIVSGSALVIVSPARFSLFDLWYKSIVDSTQSCRKTIYSWLVRPLEWHANNILIDTLSRVSVEWS